MTKRSRIVRSRMIEDEEESFPIAKVTLPTYTTTRTARVETERRIPDLDKLPRLIELEGKRQLVASFCLKCKTPNLDATAEVHKGCGGTIILLHATSGGNMSARDKVEMELRKLNEDEEYLEEVRKVHE